jgi:hypothetical protein
MNWSAIGTGIAAGTLVLLVERCISAGLRWRLAHKFTGKFDMFERESRRPGTVRVE